MDTVPMTREGLDNLKAEVAELEERRPKVMLQIKEAREKGDLSENAEYHAAREDLMMLEGRIRELKDKIAPRGHSGPEQDRRQQRGLRGHRQIVQPPGQ